MKKNTRDSFEYFKTDEIGCLLQRLHVKKYMF